MSYTINEAEPKNNRLIFLLSANLNKEKEKKKRICKKLYLLLMESLKVLLPNTNVEDSTDNTEQRPFIYEEPTNKNEFQPFETIQSYIEIGAPEGLLYPKEK